MSGCQAFAQKLNRDVNVFFGLNGSGKTTLLKILHAALAKDTSVLRDPAFKSASVTIYSHAYKNHFTLSVAKPLEPEVNEMAETVPVFPTLFDQDVILQSTNLILPWKPGRAPEMTWDVTPILEESDKTRWAHEYLPTARLYREIPGETGKRAGMSEQELDKHYSAIMQRAWREYALDVGRSIREIQDRGFRDIILNKTEARSKIRWQRRLKRERPTGTERKIAHPRVRMEGWRQRRPSQATLGRNENHS